MDKLICPNCGSKNIKKKFGDYNQAAGFIAWLFIGLYLIFKFDYLFLGIFFLICSFGIAVMAINDIVNGKRTFKNVLNGYSKYTCNECGHKFEVNIDGKK